MMRTLSVSNEFFAEAAEHLRRGEEVRLLVQGNSMLPFILGGRDQVTLVPFHGQDRTFPWALPLSISGRAST